MASIAVDSRLLDSHLREQAEDIEGRGRRDLGKPCLDLLGAASTVSLPQQGRVTEQRRIALPPEAELHLATPRTTTYTKLVYGSEH